MRHRHHSIESFPGNKIRAPYKELLTPHNSNSKLTLVIIYLVNPNPASLQNINSVITIDTRDSARFSRRDILSRLFDIQTGARRHRHLHQRKKVQAANIFETELFPRRLEIELGHLALT